MLRKRGANSPNIALPAQAWASPAPAKNNKAGHNARPCEWLTPQLLRFVGPFFQPLVFALLHPGFALGFQFIQFGFLLRCQQG